MAFWPKVDGGTTLWCRAQKDSTSANEATGTMASSHDFALSCFEAESNDKVQGEYRGCLTVKLTGSERTVMSRSWSRFACSSAACVAS